MHGLDVTLLFEMVTTDSGDIEDIESEFMSLVGPEVEVRIATSPPRNLSVTPVSERPVYIARYDSPLIEQQISQ